MNEAKEHPNKGYRDAYGRAEKMEHDGWYGSPAKRPPSVLYRENYEKIFKKEIKNARTG